MFVVCYLFSIDFKSDSFSIGIPVVIHGRTYRILDIIGQGGEATVYRCKDSRGSQYAMKVFYFSRYPFYQLRQRIDGFHKEGTMMKYLSGRSRHFVNMIDYEYIPDENIGYMIMELGDGSLRQHLRGGPLTDKERQKFWKQIVGILTALEDAKIGANRNRCFFLDKETKLLFFCLKYMRILNRII